MRKSQYTSLVASSLCFFSAASGIHTLPHIDSIRSLHGSLLKIADNPAVSNILGASSESAYKVAADQLMQQARSFDVRIMLTKPDGSVVYDSSKGRNNTFENSAGKRINENHNTRISIMTAQTSDSGFSWEIKESTSTNIKEAYTALRIGPVALSLGTLRISKRTL